MPSRIPDETSLNTHTIWSQGLKYLFSSESAIITTTSKNTLHSTQGSQRFLSGKLQTFSRPFPDYLQLFPDPVKSKSLALVTLNPSAHSKLEPSDGADSLTAGGCLAETSDDTAAEDDVALAGCGTTNRAMGDAALSLTFTVSACAFCRPCDSLPRLPPCSKRQSWHHTPHSERSHSFQGQAKLEQNRSSESHSVENLHFPISSKTSRGAPRNAKKIVRPSQEKRNTIKSISSAFEFFVVFTVRVMTVACSSRCTRSTWKFVWKYLHALVDPAPAWIGSEPTDHDMTRSGRTCIQASPRPGQGVNVTIARRLEKKQNILFEKEIFQNSPPLSKTFHQLPYYFQVWNSQKRNPYFFQTFHARCEPCLHSTFYTLKKNWRQHLTYQDRGKKEELNKTHQRKERPSGTKRYWENRIEEVF